MSEDTEIFSKLGGGALCSGKLNVFAENTICSESKEKRVHQVILLIFLVFQKSMPLTSFTELQF